MPHPTIIAFEGIDGSGKTVQMYQLERTLVRRGMRVMTLSFPVYSSFFGKEIGKLLTHAEGISADEVDGKSMALWFALDRFDAFRDIPYEEIDVLLINRYVLSNAVYQSVRERDLNSPDLLEFVLDLEHNSLGLPVPDAYVYLDVDLGSAGANVSRKGYRDYAGNQRDVYESQVGIQQRARAKYLEFAGMLDNVLVIPCMAGGRQRAEMDIAEEIEDLLLREGLL